MEASNQPVKLTKQQQRVIQLLFKFRFVSCPALAEVMGIRHVSLYEVLEYLVKVNLVTKVYRPEYRISRRPAYYYLNKTGVTTVRKIMEVKESVVHAVYANDKASLDFIQLCLLTLDVYTKLSHHLPESTQIFTKTELSRFKQFPRNRPDLYIRTPDGREAIVVIASDKPPYIIRKRLDEIITHSEDEGWNGDYPTVCFILKDSSSMYSFLYNAKKKLDEMGFDEDELMIMATYLKSINASTATIWHKAEKPSRAKLIF